MDSWTEGYQRVYRPDAGVCWRCDHGIPLDRSTEGMHTLTNQFGGPCLAYNAGTESAARLALALDHAR